MPGLNWFRLSLSDKVLRGFWYFRKPHPERYITFKYEVVVVATARKMAGPNQSDAVDNRCSKCGYQWEYSGDLWTTTCPRCNKKTKTPLHPDNQETASAD